MRIELPTRVAANIDLFTGRTWLLPEVLTWWEERTSERLFLLTGGPGTGKSMILAWLSGFGPEPHDAVAAELLTRIRTAVKASHFCQAASRNITPQAFAESIANQLTYSVKGFAEALAQTLAERVQIVGSAQAGTAATGANLTGVSIVRIDLGTLGDELSFDRSFTQPLKSLYESGHAEPMLFLIDAVDEAQNYTGVTIPDLLARLSDLPVQIRFLVTSRNEPRVLKFFRHIQPFDLIRDASPDFDDVQVYAAQRLMSASVGEATRTDFADRLAGRARGIFLYAAIVLDELLARPSAELPDLDAYPLPDGLTGLYHDFLNRELGKDERLWFDLHEPLLGLIAVAQGDGLTARQLTEITGKDLRAALRASKQYLSGELPEGPFRPFHKSFADFLLDDKANLDYHIDATRMHCQIADHYWDTHSHDWRHCPDDYGLNNLAFHLYEAGNAGRLQALMSKSWMEARYERSRASYSGFLADVDLAWRATLSEEAGKTGLLSLIRLQTMRQVVGREVSAYTDLDLETMVWLGRADEAIGQARSRSDSQTKFDALMAVYRALKEKGRTHAALPDGALLEDALEVAQHIPNDVERVKALADLAVAFTQASDVRADAVFDQAQVVRESIVDEGHQTEAAYALVRTLAEAERFDQATAIAQTIKEDSWRMAGSRELVTSLSKAKRFEAANKIARDIEPDDLRAAALSRLGAAMALERDFHATAVLDKAYHLAYSVQDDHRRAYALREAAVALAQADDSRASEAFKLARQVIESFRSDHDKTWALVPLAEALAQTGRRDEAIEVTRSIQDYQDRASALHIVARVLAQTGDLRANSLVEEAVQLVRSRDPYQQLDPLIKLATALAKVGNQLTSAIFERAIALARFLPDDRDWSQSRRDLAVALLRAGRFTEAEEVRELVKNAILFEEVQSELAAALAEAGRFDEALSIACSIERDVEQATALGRVTVELAESGCLDEARQVLASIPRDFNRATSLIALAAVLVRIGDDSAEATFGDAYKQALSIDEGYLSDLLQATALSDLAVAFAHAGRFDKAMEIVPLIRATIDWARAMGGIALAWIQIHPDQQDQADTLFNAVWRLGQDLQDDWERGRVLLVLAEALAKGERLEEAKKAALLIQAPLQRSEALTDLAAAYARAHQFSEALTALGTRELDDFLQSLAEWAEAFEQVEPAFSVAVLREASEVAGWVRPDWWQIHELLRTVDSGG